jgi:hypothetical protein
MHEIRWTRLEPGHYTAAHYEIRQVDGRWQVSYDGGKPRTRATLAEAKEWAERHQFAAWTRPRR